MRLALRSLWKNPAFTSVALLALALGIGTNTAIFSVIDALLLRPLPYAEPGRLVLMWEHRIGRSAISVSYPDFLDWRKQTHSFDSIAARRPVTHNLIGVQEPEQIEGSEVTSGLFALLGVQPAMGRSFRPEEDGPGALPLAVITDSLWKRRFNGDPSVLGAKMNLDGQPHTIIGVMPPGFRYPYTHLKGEIYTSLGRQSDDLMQRAAHPGIYAIGRLKTGVTIEQARADLKSVASALGSAYPASNLIITADLENVQARMVSTIRPALLILAVAVGFVLLIACANVANLLLAKSAGRREEIAVRVALGATRRHLIRQLLAEGLVLAMAGALLGLIFAWVGLRGLVFIVPPDTPRASEIALNFRALLFTLAAAIATGVTFGLVPARAASRDMHDALKEGSRRSSGGARHQRARSALVVAEMALSLVLLTGAALMLTSFVRMLHTSSGIQPENVSAIRLSLPEAQYTTPTQAAAFFDQLLDRPAHLPGVRSIGMISPLPLGGSDRQDGFVPEGKVIRGPEDVTTADIAYISPAYFRTMGVPLLEGRPFDAHDTSGSTPVCVIDETLRKNHFNDRDPVGRRIVYGAGGSRPRTLEIIGVVGHVKNYGVDQPSRVEIYLPYAQNARGTMTLVVKADDAFHPVVPAIRAEVHRIDPNQPIAEAVTMDQLLADTMAEQRLSMSLLVVFAATALLLASIGLYGVISYSVTQRKREFGIRLALGARGSSLIAMVLKQAGALCATGIVLGLAVSFALTRLMSSLLFGVSAADPATFALVAIVLALVALLASYIPARRATRVDPIVALRCD